MWVYEINVRFIICSPLSSVKSTWDFKYRDVCKLDKAKGNSVSVGWAGGKKSLKFLPHKRTTNFAQIQNWSKSFSFSFNVNLESNAIAMFHGLYQIL